MRMRITQLVCRLVEKIGLDCPFMPRQVLKPIHLINTRHDPPSPILTLQQRLVVHTKALTNPYTMRMRITDLAYQLVEKIGLDCPTYVPSGAEANEPEQHAT